MSREGEERTLGSLGYCVIHYCDSVWYLGAVVPSLDAYTLPSVQHNRYRDEHVASGGPHVLERIENK